ncbi:hypothetical protein M8R20_14985 [Pseudomonas sp. R2.Fl]|nr:hypothetical protein [Pseudomonas sp. R2.Fl]
MQINASTLTDPALRPQLEQYYENKKAATVAAWKEREDDIPREATITLPDGRTETLTPMTITAEQIETMFVSFDKWVEFMSESLDRSSTDLARAEERLAQIEEFNPDSSSNVRATFSRDGVLYAYINADGTLVSSNGAEKYLQGLEQTADENGLTGELRADYLARETEKILSDIYPELEVGLYDEATSPTLRDFANTWYHGYDAQQIYDDALAGARDHYETVKQWHTQWQTNLYDIQSFLLNSQAA